MPRSRLLIAWLMAALLGGLIPMQVAEAQGLVKKFWQSGPQKPKKIKRRAPVSKKPAVSPTDTATGADTDTAETAQTSENSPKEGEASLAGKTEPGMPWPIAWDGPVPKSWQQAKSGSITTAAVPASGASTEGKTVPGMKWPVVRDRPSNPKAPENTAGVTTAAVSATTTPKPPAVSDPAPPEPDKAKAEAAKASAEEDARAAARRALDARAAADEAAESAKLARDAADLAAAVAKKKDEMVIPTAARPDADPVVAAAFNMLNDKEFSAKADKDDVAAAKIFYGTRSGPGIWMGSEGYHAKGKAALAELGRAEDWGLESRFFEVPPIPSSQSQPQVLGEAEIRLTMAALKYARHARGGRINPRSLSRIWDQDPPVKDPAEVLNALAQTSEPDAILRDLHPKHEQFERLRQVLLKMRGPAEPEEPADPALLIKIPKTKSLKPGAEDDVVALLRKRLKVPAQGGAKETQFDDKLVDAVKAFQKDNGLDAGGWLNQATRAALNAEGETKKSSGGRDTQRILVNMERWRWMPEKLGKFYVWDNIPEYMVRVVKDDAVIHKDKIIVGQTTWPTPVFSADLLYIIYNPEWGMPNGIKMKELLPRIQNSGGGGFFDSLFGGGGGGSVIRAYGLRVYSGGRQIDPDSVNWSSANIKNYSFVQPAGPKNPLGAVKFRFPNKHDVYMHDTPERELFARSSRALSHGCIRVNNPMRFADILQDYDRANGGSRGDAALKNPIPVHITYFTAIAGENGKVSTFTDIYGHDSRLSSAMGGKALPYVAPPPEDDSVGAVATSSPDSNSKKKKPSGQNFEDVINNIFLN